MPIFSTGPRIVTIIPEEIDLFFLYVSLALCFWPSFVSFSPNLDKSYLHLYQLRGESFADCLLLSVDTHKLFTDMSITGFSFTMVQMSLGYK